MGTIRYGVVHRKGGRRAESSMPDEVWERSVDEAWPAATGPQSSLFRVPLATVRQSAHLNHVASIAARNWHYRCILIPPHRTTFIHIVYVTS